MGTPVDHADQLVTLLVNLPFTLNSASGHILAKSINSSSGNNSEVSKNGVDTNEGYAAGNRDHDVKEETLLLYSESLSIMCPDHQFSKRRVGSDVFMRGSRMLQPLPTHNPGFGLRYLVLGQT